VYQKDCEVVDMSISEVMSTCVTECTEDTPLDQVYERVQKCEHGIVVVVDSKAHRVPIAIVSERSICEQLIVRGRNPRKLTAGDVMDSRIITVRETDDIDRIAQEKRDPLSAIIVTNERREACGIVPKNRIPVVQTAVAATHSPGLIFVNTNVRRSPAAREIPAFGWIQ
jgi:predicted transcriptional regulator